MNLVLSNTYTNQRTLAEDSGHSLGIVNRSIKTLIAEGYLDESIQPTQKAIEILYNFTKDTKKYIWKDSIKTYLEEQNEPTEELDMLVNASYDGGVLNETEKDMLCCRQENNRVTGWLTSSPKRMEVVLMNYYYFVFKDLLAFGMFILALLTFEFTVC